MARPPHSVESELAIDIGSSHKQFVAAAALLLAEEKRLTLLEVVLERWQSFET